MILPAKVRKPHYKSSVENAVGILEKGLFHDLEERSYFDLGQFNHDLREKIDELNEAPLKGKPFSRYDRWVEEQKELLPLPKTVYHFMERKEAKVFGDYHVRFDNAYYSVPKEYAHKRVLIRASEGKVRICSINGDLLCEWDRARHKGQWLTNPEHLPANYKGMAEWSSPYFIRKAMTVGPNTTDVIKAILTSRQYEVQTYRQCIGVLNFQKKYGQEILEECCRQAIEHGKASYTYVKNTIPLIVQETRDDSHTVSQNNAKNREAYVMDPSSSDLNRLLAKSQALIRESAKGGEQR